MRAIKIINSFLEYLVFYKFNRHKNKILGKRLRQACEKLGVVFIKFGQMLSTRYDVLSEKDCMELQKLLDKAPELSYSKVKEIFLHDFGKLPEDLFLEFDFRSVASASISQVYKAKLHSGEEVAVKVRRPYLGKIIKKDVDIILNLSRLFSLFSSSLRTLNVVELVKELKRWLLSEIDFVQEAKNINVIKENYSFSDGKRFMRGLSTGMFIKSYVHFSSDNIITMDFVNGIPLSNVESIKKNKDMDLALSLKTYICAATYSLFNTKGDYYFQADPHLGNIFILEDGKAANVDWGLMGIISAKDIIKIKRLFLSVYSQDLDRTVKDALLMCSAYNKKNAIRIRADVRKYLSHTSNEGIGYWFMELVKIFVKHKIKVPYFLAAFGRCNFVLDGTFSHAVPNSTTLDLIKPILERSLRKEIFNNIKGIKYEPLLYKLSETIRDSPVIISSILDDISKNPSSIKEHISKFVNA